MTSFLNRVAELHNPYLQQNGMKMDEPYSPLPYDRVEDIMRQTPGQHPPTGSFMSTASMLGGVRSGLSKECNADSLLEILADHDYDTDRALVTIQSNLNRITSGWTRAEKDIFDDGFRRHQGALRTIAKAIGPTKSLQDVIDYYYRCTLSCLEVLAEYYMLLSLVHPTHAFFCSLKYIIIILQTRSPTNSGSTKTRSVNRPSKWPSASRRASTTNFY